MKKGKIDFGVFLVGAIILILAGGALFAVFSLRSDPLDEVFAGDRVINTLFVIEHKRKPLSSFVVMYYPATNRATVYDIPGDVGFILQQINKAGRIDAVYDHRNTGDFEREIEGLLGQDISFTLVFTLENLGKIVDLLEGVDIFIPGRLSLFDLEPPVLFPSGMIRLDGEKTVRYVGYSIPEENREDSHARRQRFFLGFLKRLGEKNEYLKNPSVSRVYHRLVSSETKERARTRLFDEFAKIDTERVVTQTVTGELRELAGETLLYPTWDGNQIKSLVRQTLSSLTRQAEGGLADRTFTVEVLNGTITPGLARRTADIFQGFGYDIIKVDNAETNDYEKTEIIDYSGLEGMAKNFGDIIRCTNIVEASREAEDDMNMDIHDYTADFTLIIGKDFNGRYVSGQ